MTDEIVTPETFPVHRAPDPVHVIPDDPRPNRIDPRAPADAPAPAPEPAPNPDATEEPIAPAPETPTTEI